ncbi:MAG: hypothetical protein K2L83_04140 [Muribaculaceae bacterium]|nr:hypothetical protein [Muribaculaceae bacterium]MDE6329886.1 hypothetical protein [Muribaculaceae bacterium]
MSDSPAVVLAGIQNKIARLASERDDARKQCAELRSTIEQLKADIAERDEKLHYASLEIEFLSISHKLADTPQALADARKKIAGLIRRIDAAIALIKSDPADL